MRASSPRTGQHRLAVASRTAAAVLGGYALASCFALVISLLVRTPREEAVLLGSLPSFLILLGAVLWSFAARSALRAWLGIIAPLIALALLAWLLGPSRLQ